MPIFDNELINNTSEPKAPTAKPFLGSPETREVDTRMGGFSEYGQAQSSGGGLSIDDMSKLSSTPNKATFDSPFQMVPKSELLDNKRYALYERDKDLENIYGLHQSWASQLGNGVIKMGLTAAGAFAQSFATLPDTVSAIKNGQISDLTGGMNGYEAQVDDWLKNIEDRFPNYVTRKEQEHPFLAAIPGFAGSANFWGNGIIKNIGFTVGAIGGAVTQDAIIGVATEGIGEIPIISAQLGKAALWLNKVFTGTNDVEKVIDIAKGLGKTEKQILNIEKLGQLAAATKITDAARYSVSLYGSSRTEAGIEARDGFRQVKEELTRQYKLDNLGAEPTPEEVAKIDEYATNAMNTRFGINMALLTASNAIQFDNVLKSFSSASTKGIAGGAFKELEEAGKIGLKEGSIDTFEKKVAPTLAGKVWDSVKPQLANVFSEGVYEEGGQYAAERGTYDYYTRKYKNLNDPKNKNNWDTLNEVINSTTQGLSAQFNTTEGIENMLVGGLSAMITGGVMGKVDSIKGRGKDARLQSSINILNQYGLTGILQDKYGDTLDSIGIANDMKEAAASGNLFKYKNLKHDMFFNMVNSRIPAGLHDVTIEQLNMLKDLDKGEFEKMFGIDFSTSNKQTVSEYVDGLINSANQIKATVDSLDNTFKNPFKHSVDPKTDEEAIESRNFNTFNKWKTDIAYYSSVTPDINDRLNSIEQDVVKVNPLLNNDLLAKVTDPQSLKELAKSYEEQATSLSESVSEFTTAEDKKRIKAEVKALRTNSEKINLAINNKDLDLKTFNTLLNFELNNQDATKESIVPIERSSELFGYGHDINRANALKARTSEILDNLITKDGFEKYFEQADVIANGEIPEGKTEDIEYTDVTGVATPKFTNKAGEEEVVKVGKDYELPKVAKAKVKKLADDRYEVTSPDGKVSFHDTKEAADAAAEEINDDNNDLRKVKVVAVNDDGTVKVEDAAGNIQNIPADKLAGYERVETEEDRLLKNQAQINKEQAEIEKNSGLIAAVDTSDVKAPEEGKLKSAETLFTSGITESEDYNDPTQSAPHIKRSREFLNNTNTVENRGQLRAILVTPNQVDALGLTGLVQLSYNVNADTKVEDIQGALDVDSGFVAQVFAIQKGKDLFFVDKNGKALTKVGEQVDLNEVVFQTMPTTSLTNSKGEPRYRSGEKEEAEAASRGWKALRAQMFSAPADAFNSFKFDVSRGIAIEIKDADGNKEKNQVGKVLVPENKIATQEGLVTIPTTGAVIHKGQILKFPNGVPVLQFGDTIQFLNNRKFNNREANGIFQVINALASDIVKQSEAGKTVKINRAYSTFLQNVLYWKSKAETTSDNQIRIDVDNMTLNLGRQSYSLTDIANNGTQIVNQLENAYHNVNGDTLKNKFNEPFTEYYINKDGIFTTSEWKNYQSYLLSSNYPSGPSRTAGDTPLTTSVAKPTESIPYSFKQKSATLLGVELPVVKAPAKVVSTEPSKPTIGEYTIDGTTKNLYNLQNGPVEFTASISPEGEVSVSVIGNNTVQSIADNKKLVNDAIVPALKTADKFSATANDEQLVLDFIALRISADLQEQKNAEAPKAEVKPEVKEEAPVKPEAPKEKKADKFSGFNGPSAEYRLVGSDSQERMTDAELQLFKEWHAANVPNIPFEVLNNIITTADGEKAWGAFENGVAKFVKGGLRATEYHEVFEAIYKGILSKEEQQGLLDEFKAKSGTFIDRASGKKIAYDEATDLQAKERIADDFADFRKGKLPARSLGEKIRNFFKTIMDFFKSFVGKPSLKEELFKSIDTGGFKDKVLKESADNEFAEYRAVAGLTEQQTHEFVQDMTARAAGILYTEGQKKLLFTPLAMTGEQMFDQIEEQYANETNADGFSKLDLLGEEAWSELKTKTKQSLRTLGVTFNEDDRADINNEEATKNDYAPEPFSTDWKKNSTGAIKFSLATLLEAQATNQEGSVSLQLPAPKLSSIGGYKLLNFSRAFATVLDKLSNTSSVTKVVDKLSNLAEYDPNYVRLFSRVGGNNADKSIPFSQFTNDDWRYFIQFTQTFTKQKPDALIQYKVGNEVYIAPANLYTAIQQTKQSWVENMKAISKESNGFIKRETKTYQVDSEKLKSQSIKTPKNMIAFLGELGINFELDVYNTLKSSQKNAFAKAVSSIYTYLGSNPDIMSVTSKTLGVNGPLSTLAELYNKVTNPNQESTYSGVENQRIGSFSENNTPSVFENEFNEANTLDELLEKRPELKDIFSTNSQVLKKGGLFFDKDGNRIKEIKLGYIQGTKSIDNNKGIKTTKLGLGDRFTQEINNNLEGNYYVLIPGDSSTEWMMNLGNTVSFKDIEGGKAWSNINKIFRGYLSDDIALALDADNRQHLKNVGNKSKELRFFKDILPASNLEDINYLIQTGATQEQIEQYINDPENINDINASIKEYIESTAAETRNILLNNNQVSQIEEDMFSYSGIIDSFEKSEKLNKNEMSSETLDNILTFANVNYIINNIEYHKVLFGDPFQFAVEGAKLEETKRVKSFLSPRRTTFDSSEYNTFLNENANKVGDIELTPEDYGYQQFKSYTDTISVKEVKLAGSLSNIIAAYGNTKEADAASWLIDGTYREIKMKNGQWSDEAEAWHQWQMAYTRQNITGYTYTNDALEAHDKELVSKPAPKHTIEVLKPIVSGNKFGENKFNLVLDKFSQMPIYYSMVQGTNLEKLYDQMFKKGIGYAVVESGRKVGVDKTHSLYNADGSFNEEAFAKNTQVQVPWKAYGIQVETTSEDNKQQTRGSQLTKLSSMDLFDNGVPSSEVAKAEYERNKDILNKLHENAYNDLLLNLGVEDMNNGFILTNGKAVSETLMYEMLRRKVSDNTKDAIQLDKNNQFRIPFEAAPSYLQIRSILYSMVDKALIRPKMNGGSHVQVPVTGFESATKGRDLAIKTDKGWTKISKEAYAKLSDEQKKNVVLTDSTLKFYTKADPYCEIMLPHWFKGKFKGMSDEQILAKLNTPEGKEILTGIGFRIPTQALSSIEVFRVKGFLPQYMGSTVVVPSEITTKAGSDFDIDKLNMYLKSTYVDQKGNVRLVKSLGSEEATKEFYGNVFDERINIKAIKKAELLEAFRIVAYDLADPNNLVDKYSNLLDVMLDGVEDLAAAEDKMVSDIDKLTDEGLQSDLRNKFVKDMYKRSLENEYYDSLEKLITLPENFDRLISPVDDAGLEKLSEKLNSLRGYNEDQIKNRILDRNYMTTLRNAFVTAKRWVGIAAVNITNLSLKQKSKVYIDPARFANLSLRDQKLIGDGKIVLKHNTVNINGEELISLSGTTVKDSKELISNRLSGYATSFVDVANKPYITSIIQSDLVVGTFMFLENAGVGAESAIFLNQPIISEYLKMLDGIGAKNLFTAAYINVIKSKFVSTTDLIESAEVDVNGLEKNIKDYYTGNKDLGAARNAEQVKILDEFLKYAKMAEYAFKFTQATNYDTSTFKNGSAFARKTWNTDIARNSNIISSVDNILDNTFIGKQKLFLGKSMQAMGAILKLEQDSLRVITEDILKPYGENPYFSNDNFDKLSNKVTADFLDYIIQTKTGINNAIKELLVDPNTSVAVRLEQAKKDYPNVQLLRELQVVSGNRADGAKSVKLTANLKDAYDENLYTGMMRELRDYNDELNQLYKDLITVSILQGTYQSAISIKNIVPIEDYAVIVQPIISGLTADGTLDAFAQGMFHVNNFSDDVIMPVVQPKFFHANAKPGEAPEPIAEQLDSLGNYYADIYQYYSSLFPNIEAFNIKSSERKILLLNEKWNASSVSNDFIKVPRVVTDKKTGASIDMVTGQTITRMDYAIKKAKGDNSLQDVFGYAKVKLPNGEALTTPDKQGNLQHVYKLVNLLGDGARASEYYETFKESVLENGTIKTNQEIPDANIIEYYGGKVETKDVSLQLEPKDEIKPEGLPAIEDNNENNCK